MNIAPQPTVLVVEDEQDTLDLVAYYLEKAGCKVLNAMDGIEGLRLSEKERPDLVVLDLMLPEMDGKEVCRRIRQADSVARTPILMLTAKASELDRIMGFEVGADDYVTKPFSPRELVLRVEAILKRTFQQEPSSNRLASGGLVIDSDRHMVISDEGELQLTATEFRLLHYLATHAGMVLSRETLLDQVWGYSFDGYARTVDTHIRRLRTKLGSYKDCIETVRGVGYRFRETT
jgi:two-component system phosphate regulon response regulator PhoB